MKQKDGFKNVKALRMQELREKLNAAEKRLRGQYDGLRHDIDSNMRLRGGEDPAEARRRENAAAVGGMRNPRESLKKVPGHLPVAAEAVSIIRTFLKSHPGIAPDMLISSTIMFFIICVSSWQALLAPT